MKFGLKENTINKIIQVFSGFREVEEVIIYGSRAKGNYKPGSDIDLTVKGNGLNLSVLNKIELQLDEMLFPYTLDISIFQQIDNVELLEHINRVGKIIYSKEKKFVN